MADPVELTSTNRASTTIAYSGPALAEGTMDVRDLGSALLALGQLCQATNQALNGDRAEVNTYVRSSMRGGSFEVSIDLVQAVTQAKDLLAANREALSDAKTLLEILGLIGGGVTAGGMALFRFIRWLRNRKPDKTVELPSGLIRVEIAGDKVEISGNTMVLAHDEQVRRAMHDVTQPLQRKGIDTFEQRSGERPEELATSHDVDAFTPPLLEEAPPNILGDSEHTAVLEVRRPFFKAGHRWGLYDGQRLIGAYIRDDVFMDKVERRELTFGRGDALRVKLHTRAWRDDAGALNVEHVVTEVLDVLPAPSPAQAKLFPNGPEREGGESR